MPNANTSENSTIIFRLTPAEFSKINERNMENGIATPTNNAFLKPKKNKRTKTTKITPKTMEFSRLLT